MKKENQIMLHKIRERIEEINMEIEQTLEVEKKYGKMRSPVNKLEDLNNEKKTLINLHNLELKYIIHCVLGYTGDIFYDATCFIKED